MKIAVIDDNKVVNIINAKSVEIAERLTGKKCISYQNGWDNEDDITGFHLFNPEVEVFFPEVTE